MPIVKISRAMKGLAVGQCLEVLAADEAFSADLEAWVSTRTDRLVSFEDAGGEQRAVIERGA
jgi:TusA-related sulfurtransferase